MGTVKKKTDSGGQKIVMSNKKKRSGAASLLSRMCDVMLDRSIAALTIALSGGRVRVGLNGSSFFDLDRGGDVMARRNNRRALSELARQGLIVCTARGSMMHVALTDKGLRRMLSARIRRAPPCPAGECLLLIFDIPERERSIRRQLRLFLCDHGFFQVQKSVWAVEKEITGELQEFLRRIDADEWVQLFRGTRIRRSSALRSS